jgi:cytochrome oxidase Cu insertion factor (SCO1/SenC/PrrC family)
MRRVHRSRRRALPRDLGQRRALTLTRPRVLWLAAALAAAIAVVALWIAPRPQPATGTVVVIAAARSAGPIDRVDLSIREAGAGWTSLGSIDGVVPAAPAERDLLTLRVPAGSYDSVRLGTATTPVNLKVTAGVVTPLLLGFEGGALVDGAVYAGNDDVNLGLGELAGRYVAMPPFQLTDQSGKPFTLGSITGQDTIIAAFHTNCHETCPLYTALFLQLAKRVAPTTRLVEVTTDPATDRPPVLARYAENVGATWTFATGTADQVASFWKPFAVELATGDAHTSTLALVDRHGFLRLVYRGVPKVGNDIPPALVSTLSPQGLGELAAGGDGWGAPDVLEALATVTGGEQSTAGGGGKAQDFTLASTAGGDVSLRTYAGKPVVINFWATYCPPCRAEMPLLAADVPKAGAQLVLVNEGQDARAARDYLSSIGVGQPSLLDADMRAGRAYRVSALPTTVFVRSDGTVDRVQIGELDASVLASELSNLVSQ